MNLRHISDVTTRPARCAPREGRHHATVPVLVQSATVGLHFFTIARNGSVTMLSLRMPPYWLRPRAGSFLSATATADPARNAVRRWERASWRGRRPRGLDRDIGDAVCRRALGVSVDMGDQAGGAGGGGRAAGTGAALLASWTFARGIDSQHKSAPSTTSPVRS